MSNMVEVVSIPQEHVPTLTSADENPTPTSNDDKCPIKEHVPTDEDHWDSPEQLLISRLHKEIEKSREQCSSTEQITKLQMIPQIMFQQRKCGKDYYRPSSMTIGPIFNSEKGQELKYQLAAQFIRNSGKTINDLLVSIQNEIETLSTCFDNQVLLHFTRLQNNGTDLHNCKFHPLARTLFLDGCSILQFIYSRVWGKLTELKIKYGQASLIEEDLFLMENQIPFRVLEILMDVMSKDGAFNRIVLEQSIDIFIRMNLTTLMTPANFLKRSYLDFYRQLKKKPVHLLDILRSGLLYAFDPTNISSSYDCSSNNEPKREFICNIKELKAAGIKLESSGISCLGDVTFTSFGRFRARFKLPPLIVNDSTVRKLWNLVAFEMCPENYNSDYGVTSYLSLLNSLIDSEEDVKELRSARVLRNHLSSDNELAKLFNEIGFDIVPDQAYREVKQKVQMHFDNWWTMSIAQFLQEYFRSPWTFIALWVAIAVCFNRPWTFSSFFSCFNNVLDIMLCFSRLMRNCGFF